MSDISKSERYDLEQKVFNSRSDGGVRHIRDWSVMRREELNRRWPSATGDELVAMQGEAKAIDMLVKLIEQGPKIKPTIGEPAP